MHASYALFGIQTGLIQPGDSLFRKILSALEKEGELRISDGDILVIAESAVASAQGRIVPLCEITPSGKAEEYAERFQIDPRLAEVVIHESDEIIGGIPGFLLCIRDGHLLPNAGVDGSNAPPGSVTLLPNDPNQVAHQIRMQIRDECNTRVGVIIVDSRTHPMRYGCSGIAIGCSGIQSVIDERGRTDLFGRELMVTRRAIADNIASASENLMGEADEGIPVVLVRGLKVQIGEFEGIEQISADECLFMGSMRRMNRI